MKKLSIILLSVFLVETCNADVGSALVDYYNSMGANTKLERPSLTTNGVTMGGFYQRNANVDMTLGYITPPTLKGGCGNIDFNLGAFSFISSDQIVAALKAIAQNAQALLFTEAIDIVSSQLGGNLKMWIAEANKWLGILKNSCQASSMLVGGLNQATGMCQNAARFKNSLSDENTVQSTCQSFNQGMKPYKELFGNTSDDAQNAKRALATQLKLQGGIIQNMLAEYFNEGGKLNGMNPDMGNLIISIVGDVYVPKAEDSADNQGMGTSIAVPSAGFKLSDLLNIDSDNYTDQQQSSNWKVYDCKFDYDVDTFRAKNDCFDTNTKNYKTVDGKSVLKLYTDIYDTLFNIFEKISDPTSGPGLNAKELRLLSMSEAPVYQLLQAGVDTGTGDEVYDTVVQWENYNIHKMILMSFTNVRDSIQMQLAALSGGANETQRAQLDTILVRLNDSIAEIKAQLIADKQTYNLDLDAVITRLNNLKIAISKSTSPELREQLSFASVILGGK